MHLFLRRLSDVIAQHDVLSCYSLNDNTALIVRDPRYGVDINVKAEVVAVRYIRLSLLLTGSIDDNTYNCIRKFLDKISKEDGVTIYYDDITRSMAAAADFSGLKGYFNAENMEDQLDYTLYRLRAFKMQRHIEILQYINNKC